jgi:hypothetical protein
MAKSEDTPLFDFLEAVKRCTKCGESRPLAEFRFGRTNGKGRKYYESHCNTCCNKRAAASRRRRYANDLEFRAKDAERRHWMKIRQLYGLTREQYGRMHDSQSGLCAICLCSESPRTGSKPRRLSVDHCHSSGAIRGLLCNRCNRVCGFAQDNSAILRKAADYLRRFRHRE